MGDLIRALERRGGKRKRVSADVYALGAMLCMAGGDPLPLPTTALERAYQIAHGVCLPAPPVGLSPELNALLTEMVAAEPSRRPSARDVARRMTELATVAVDIELPLVDAVVAAPQIGVDLEVAHWHTDPAVAVVPPSASPAIPTPLWVPVATAPTPPPLLARLRQAIGPDDVTPHEGSPAAAVSAPLLLGSAIAPAVEHEPPLLNDATTVRVRNPVLSMVTAIEIDPFEQLLKQTKVSANDLAPGAEPTIQQGWWLDHAAEQAIPTPKPTAEMRPRTPPGWRAPSSASPRPMPPLPSIKAPAPAPVKPQRPTSEREGHAAIHARAGLLLGAVG